MIRRLVISWMLGSAVLGAAEPDDLLRFTNGDQLHGTFQGIKEGPRAIWLRDDVSAPVDFKAQQIRQVVLRGGRPSKSLTSVSHIALVNGDRIPGRIVEMDEKAITMDTAFAGELRIPRDQVAMFAPNPLGGRLRYHGPFIEDEWKMAHAAYPEGMPAVEQEPAEGQNAKADQPGRWAFSGSGWYWKSKSYGTAIIRENALPDRAILRFDLAWRNRLSVAIGFHADLAKPQPEEKNEANQDEVRRRPLGFVPGDSAILPKLFGNSYVLQIFSMQMILYRTSVDGDGIPSVERVQINGSGTRLGDTGKVTVEIRSNRLTGEISLFMDGAFVAQWNESAGGLYDPSRFAGKGNAFGFVVQTEDSPVKVSDVMVAEWNGMPDSARSLQADDQDIVLLTNGTDRFSGKVESFRDGRIRLDGKFGQFLFSLDDIAEIRFARNSLAKESEPPADNLTIQLSPLGQISGRPVSGSATSLRVVNPVCGEIDIALESAVVLDFHSSNNFIDDWDAEF
ncbi:MAG: hypothetical protein V4689_23355 [Verrucomicrobiota bacterium]